MVAELAGSLVVVCYTALAIFSVIVALQTGSLEKQREATLLIRILFWHGLVVICALMLTAALSFAVLFSRLALGG
jgi:hypothetical protein